MKKISKLLLILIIFIITGCDVKYNLEIKPESIVEDISIQQDKNFDIYSNLNDYGSSYYDLIVNNYNEFTNVYINSNQNLYENEKVYGVDYYKKKLMDKSDNLILKYNFNHDILKFEDAISLKICYDNIASYHNNDYFELSTSTSFNCYEKYDLLENVSISIKTDLVVYDQNADIVDGNLYIWNINKDNASNKPIYIKVSRSEYSNNLISIFHKFIKQNSYLLLMVIILIIVLFYLVYVYFKNKRNNKI